MTPTVRAMSPTERIIVQDYMPDSISNLIVCSNNIMKVKDGHWNKNKKGHRMSHPEIELRFGLVNKFVIYIENLTQAKYLTYKIIFTTIQISELEII